MHTKRRALSIGFLVYSLTLVTSILSTNANADTYYISPGGLDEHSGTSTDSPWKTFNHALPQLKPGDTLALMNGTYTNDTTGLPLMNCPAGSGYIGVRDGTSAQLPITLKALNERQAHIQGSGALVVLVNACRFWVVEGLYASNVDTNTPSGAGASWTGSVFTVWDSTDLIFRRNLAYGPNARFNSHCYDLSKIQSSLFEENECYYVARHGFLVWDSGPKNTFRRNYLHSRNHADMPGGFTTGETRAMARGDEGISCYPCRGNLFENNIVDDFDSAYTIQCKFNCGDNRYLGNIALDSGNGIGFGARADTQQNVADQMPANILIENHLILRANAIDSGCTSCKNLQIRNLSFLDSSGRSFTIKLGSAGNGEAGDGQASFFGTNILMANNDSLSISGQATWRMDRSLLFNNAGGYSPGLGDSHYTNVLTSNPQLGACKVFIPNGSPAKGAGVGGTDIGANILSRYQDGVLTSTPLWDPTTSRFPCGAQVAGVNDNPGSSCFDVHKRLNVNTNGCTLPTTSVFSGPTLRLLGITP